MTRSTSSRHRLAAAVTLVLAVTGCPVPVDSVTADPLTVDRVVDGDTLHGRVAGRAVTVRLLAIDTPETGRGGQPAQGLAAEATARTTQLLHRRPVTLVDDPTQPRHDQHGRRLGYVDTDKVDVGYVLVAEGLARSWPNPNRPARRFAAYADAERQARLGGRGMWSRCETGRHPGQAAGP